MKYTSRFCLLGYDDSRWNYSAITRKTGRIIGIHASYFIPCLFAFIYGRWEFRKQPEKLKLVEP
jgi:hypothetical protein